MTISNNEEDLIKQERKRKSNFLHKLFSLSNSNIFQKLKDKINIYEMPLYMQDKYKLLHIINYDDLLTDLDFITHKYKIYGPTHHYDNNNLMTLLLVFSFYEQTYGHKKANTIDGIISKNVINEWIKHEILNEYTCDLYQENGFSDIIVRAKHKLKNIKFCNSDVVCDIPTLYIDETSIFKYIYKFEKFTAPNNIIPSYHSMRWTLHIEINDNIVFNNTDYCVEYKQITLHAVSHGVQKNISTYLLMLNDNTYLYKWYWNSDPVIINT
jgi:hypothetical protein